MDFGCCLVDSQEPSTGNQQLHQQDQRKRPAPHGCRDARAHERTRIPACCCSPETSLDRSGDSSASSSTLGQHTGSKPIKRDMETAGRASEALLAANRVYTANDSGEGPLITTILAGTPLPPPAPEAPAAKSELPGRRRRRRKERDTERTAVRAIHQDGAPRRTRSPESSDSAQSWLCWPKPALADPGHDSASAHVDPYPSAAGAGG